MISQDEAKEFIRRYREVVLDTPYGEIHICGSKKTYDELTAQGKAAFTPNELMLLEKARQNEALDTIIKIKTLIPGAKIKEIIPADSPKDNQAG